MDHKPDLTTLLEKYLAGQCSPEEEALLSRFFEQSGAQDKQAVFTPRDRQRMLAAFRESPRFRAQPVLVAKRHRKWLWPAAAAAAVLLLVAGVWTARMHPQQLVYKEIVSPKGGLLKVTLPDSSSVILNANTTLRYAADFSAHRDLQLTGEGYFDVRKDESHPFIIHSAGGLQTKVLGTTFTIRSYEELPQTRIVVMDGRVQVQRGDTVLGVLNKAEGMELNRADGSKALETATDVGRLAAWTRGEWEYENMSVPELQSLLRNYYNINMEVQGHAAHLVANASMNFNNHQSAEDIINIFCTTANCHYKWLNHATVALY